MISTTSYHLAILFVVQTSVFTTLLFILFARRQDVRLWALSNILNAFGIAIVGWSFEDLPTSLAALSGALTLWGGSVKVLAYGASNVRKRRALVPRAAFYSSIIFGGLVIIFPETPYKLLLLSVGGSLAASASVYFILTNRAWVGMTTKWLAAFTMSISIFAMMSRAANAYPFGPFTTFMINNNEQIFNLLMLTFFNFLLQISFLALVAERNARDQIFITRRAARLRVTAMAALRERTEIAAIATERMGLLRMLTHEVRQPLNNAQAALQTIMMEIASGIRSPDLMLDMARRAQRTVSEVVLAISNSIIGATLINPTRQAALEQEDLCTVAHLALLDIDPADRGRVAEHYAQEAVFAPVDSVVLRLAVRNLLENALKFSPAGSPVAFDVAIDDDRMMATFTVSNIVDDLSLIIEDMFGFEKRGSDSKYSGMGLGLFIVKRCAELHHGEVSHSVDERGAIRFELAIPC